MRSSSEEGSYLRLADFCVAQLQAESSKEEREEEEEEERGAPVAFIRGYISLKPILTSIRDFGPD